MHDNTSERCSYVAITYDNTYQPHIYVYSGGRAWNHGPRYSPSLVYHVPRGERRTHLHCCCLQLSQRESTRNTRLFPKNTEQRVCFVLQCLNSSQMSWPGVVFSPIQPWGFHILDRLVCSSIWVNARASIFVTCYWDVGVANIDVICIASSA